MKTISSPLAAHLALGTTTIATCWKVTLQNGTVIGFTSSQTPLIFESVLYAAASGHTASAVASNADLAVDNLEVLGALALNFVTEADVRAGLWDFAQVDIFQVNFLDLTQGALKLRTGHLGEIKTTSLEYTAELRGLAQQLQQTIGEIVSAGCRANLGDARCAVDLVPLTVTGTVTSATSPRSFADSARAEADEYFDFGRITWTLGENEGISMEVKTYLQTGGAFDLQLPMPYDIGAGDEYELTPGCKKRFIQDCQTKFDNVINFQGEPDIPGNDSLLRVGGQ